MHYWIQILYPSKLCVDRKKVSKAALHTMTMMNDPSKSRNIDLLFVSPPTTIRKQITFS